MQVRFHGDSAEKESARFLHLSDTAPRSIPDLDSYVKNVIDMIGIGLNDLTVRTLVSLRPLCCADNK